MSGGLLSGRKSLQGLAFGEFDFDHRCWFADIREPDNVRPGFPILTYWFFCQSQADFMYHATHISPIPLDFLRLVATCRSIWPLRRQLTSVPPSSHQYGKAGQYDNGKKKCMMVLAVVRTVEEPSFELMTYKLA